MHKTIDLRFENEGAVRAALAILSDYGFTKTRTLTDNVVAVDIDDDFWTEGNIPTLFDFPCEVLRPDENPEGVEARCEVCGSPCDYHPDVCLCAQHAADTKDHLYDRLNRIKVKAYDKEISITEIIAKLNDDQLAGLFEDAAEDIAQTGAELDADDLEDDTWTVLEHVSATNWQEVLRGKDKSFIKGIVSQVFPDYPPAQVKQLVEAVWHKANA